MIITVHPVSIFCFNYFSVATPERQGSKRKSESSDEMEEKRSASGSTWPSTTKNEEEEVAIKRKKLETGLLHDLKTCM